MVRLMKAGLPYPTDHPKNCIRRLLLHFSYVMYATVSSEDFIFEYSKYARSLLSHNKKYGVYQFRALPVWNLTYT
jgi:hypothetical protein